MSGFNPNAPFEVLDAPAPAAAAGFDPTAPFEVEPPAPAGPPASAGRSLGLGTRGVIAGAIDTLRNPAAALGNLVPAIVNDLAGRTVIPEPFSYDLGQQAGDALGLPRPVTPQEQIVDRAVQGGAGMIGPMAGARLLQGGAQSAATLLRPPATPGQAVVGAFANNPGTDLAAGAVGGAAGGAIEQAGGGLLPQVAGEVTGNILTAVIIAAVARRRGVGPEAVRPETITPEETAAAWTDPDVRRIAEANGITDPSDPRVQQLAPRVEAARTAEAARAAVAPSVTEADLRAGQQAVAEGADPSTVAPPVRQPPPAAIALPDQSGAIPRVPTADGARATEPPLRGTPDPNAVPLDPARLRSEDRAAEQAFRQADAQRAEVAPNVRDTQPAPRPEGVNPQVVYLDQGFPVRILGRDERGFVSVERYDPRTGQPDPEAVPYVVRENTLQQRRYAVQPRAAQDFVDRSRFTDDRGRQTGPEQPRMPGEPVRQEPRQTFRATAADPNEDFPGAGSGRPPPDEQMGRSPLPDQPDGPAPGRRWSTAEEAERAFQDRRAQAEAEAQRARESGEWNAGQRSTNRPGAQDADGRWPIGPGGYVASDAGGPIRFGDQKQAARWIISEGQRRSPDQFFEIAVHPSGQGFTVREAGRNAGSETGGRGAGAADAGSEGGASGAPGRGADAAAPSPPSRLSGPTQQGDAQRAPPAPQPDGPVRPPEAQTTTRQAAPGVETPPRRQTVAERAAEARAQKEEEVRRMDADPAVAEARALMARIYEAGRRSPDAPDPEPPPTAGGRDNYEALARRAEAEGNARVAALFREAGERARRALRERNTDTADPAVSPDPPPTQGGRNAEAQAAEAGVLNRGADAPSAARGADPTNTPDGGGTPLYSNPLDPALIRRLIADPAMRGLRSLRDALKSSVSWIGQTAPNLRAAWQLGADSARATLLNLAEKYDSPAVRDVVDSLATDPGSGRRVRGTFQSEVESKSKSLGNRTRTILQPLANDEAALGRVRDILTGKPARNATPAERAAAQRLRALLDEHHAFLTKRLGSVERELGYVRGRYFPRHYDAEAIARDNAGFLADATKLYRRMGLSAADADQAANDWLNRVMGVKGHSTFGHTPQSSYSKGRVLPPDADTLMAKWLVTDPQRVLTEYFHGSTKHAEFVSRFGAAGEKVEAALDAMRRAGASPDELTVMRQTFEHATGTARSDIGQVGAGWTGWMQMHGVLALLPRAVMSSLAESLAAGIRAGSPLKSLTASVETMAQAFTPDRWKSMAAREQQEFAEMIGAVSDSFLDTSMLARADGLSMTQGQQRVVAGMMNLTFQQRVFTAQRTASSRVAEAFVRQMLRRVAEGGDQAYARRALRELGVDEAQASEMSRWLAKHNGRPPYTELLADTPLANSYRTAINRFLNEAIMSPEAVDKPVWSSSGIGRLAYSIMSFQYAFTRNVLIRSAKEGWEGIAGSGYTLEDRARLMAPLAGLLVLAGAQFGMGKIRDLLFARNTRRDQDEWTKTILAVDRAGMFGNLSPLANMLTSARYERDPSSLMSGAYMGALLNNVGRMTTQLTPGPMGPNSPNTNNAEWQAARAAWNAVVAPAVVGTLAIAPLPAWAKVPAGATAMAVGAPDTGRAVADAIAGPRQVRARTVGGNAPQRGGIGAR